MEVRKTFTRRPTASRNRFVREEKNETVIDPRLKSTVLHVVLLLCGVGFGVVVFPFIEKQMNQPVEKVSVSGDFIYLDRREVMAQIPVYQGDRLLDVNLEEIQASLESMPWIYSARVSRQWPGVILISAVEQKPIAFWNDTQLLNQYGNVFDRKDKPMTGLPLLFGMEGNEVNVMRRFLEFSQLLAPMRMKIVRLQQSEQLAWDVELDNGIRLQLGSTQALEKMQRFVFLYQNQLQHPLNQDGRSVATVDLRYNSGAAVSWKAEVVTEKVI